MKILVTGAAGFIGSAVCRYLMEHTTESIVSLDKLTYAADPDFHRHLSDHSRHRFERVDICNRGEVERVFREHQPDAVIHLAAETHVDRSIDRPDAFLETNVKGTFVLLEVARDWCSRISPERRAQFRFLHVSTDEVYGSLGANGSFSETTPYSPNSPYAASKAAADHLVRAWHHTYGFPGLISNCSNNYGPFQFPEKLIPMMVITALAGRPLPVYGTGRNVRDWLYVEDHAEALYTILMRGRLGEKYNVGGNCEMTNIDVVRLICDILDELLPDAPSRPHAKLIKFVPDRPGHDLRYAIDASKIRSELGWQPRTDFRTGLERTIRWYLDNRPWLDRIRTRVYAGERLGLGDARTTAAD